ncbi:MAG: C39 family peptidase [Patescibacteria group bacterium]
MKEFFKLKFTLILAALVTITTIIVASFFGFFARADAQDILTITEFPIVNGNTPYGITAGPDGNIWFTEYYANKIGRITPGGVITIFLIPTSLSSPEGITAGPDGNIWFTENSANKIGRITPSGTITEFPIPSSNTNQWGVTNGPRDIISGPDGNLWFTEFTGNRIGRITPNGVFTEFTLPNVSSFPTSITAGPDGNLWFTEMSNAVIGRITPEGSITEFPIPNPSLAISHATGITAGPDGNIWYTRGYNRVIGRITPDGVITEFPIVTTDQSYPSDITLGPDGNLWYVDSWTKIGRITPDGEITEFLIPTNNSSPQGITAGPDGNIWFTEYEANKIGRVNLTNLPTPPPSFFLNVPLLKQGIFPFNDNDPVWEGDEYDHGNSQSLWCGTTIASCGCAATSIAMVLRYYNIVNPVEGTVTTPSAVNDYFNQNTQCGINGCVSLGYSFGDVRWTAVNNYSAEAHKNYGTQKIIYDGGGSYDVSIVTQDINDSEPVILGVPNHWVVATGISGDTFTINDPLYSRTLLSDPAYNNTAVQGIRRYKKTNSDFSSIEVAVLAPAQVIITDPDGNKTGFEPNSSIVVSNIPNSSYFFDEALADDTGQRPAPPPNAGVHWAIVQTPQVGQYQIEVIGSSNQPYSFAIYGSDQDANVGFKLFEGQQSSTLPVHYLFEYSPIPNETAISQQVPIDVKPNGNSDIINPKSNGVIRAAILSTDTFDAMTVDSLSVKLGPSNASANKNIQTKDVNGDKKLDRVFYFSTNQTGISNGDTMVCLSGKTTDGFNIKGCSTIRTVP